MRNWIVVGCLMGCNLPPPNDYGQPTGGGDPTCAQGETWQVPSSASGTILFLEVDAVPIAASFVEGASYDVYGPSACFDTESNALSWVLEAAAEPFARITSETFGTGNLDMTDDQDGVLQIEIFGIPDPFVIRNTDFQNGTWVVTLTEDSEEWELVGTSVSTGRTTQWNIAMEMTP